MRKESKVFSVHDSRSIGYPCGKKNLNFFLQEDTGNTNHRRLINYISLTSERHHLGKERASHEVGKDICSTCMSNKAPVSSR